MYIRGLRLIPRRNSCLASRSATAPLIWPTFFIEDLASRLSHRVQISSDALRVYVDAVERAFGAEVDYGSIVKTFSHSDLEEQRRYSPPDVINVKRIPVAGSPLSI